MKNKLQYKINAVILTTFILIAAIFSSMEIPARKRELHADIAKIQTLLTTLVNQEKDDLANEIFESGLNAFGGKLQLSALRMRLQRMRSVSGIQAISLFDSHEKLILSEGVHPSFSTFKDGMHHNSPKSIVIRQETWQKQPILLYSQEILAIGERIGFVRILYSLSDIYEKQQRAFIVFMGVLGAILLTMLLLMNFLLARVVIQPIANLGKGIAGVQAGQLGEQVPVRHQDEIGELSAAFNRMSADLADSYDRLSEKSRQIALQNSELKRLDQLKDDFLANTSHELKTPLNGIIGIAESLAETTAGRLDIDQQYDLGLIIASGRRLMNRINDILDFSKLRHHELKLNNKTFNLRPVVAFTLILCRAAVGVKNIRLTNDIPEDFAPVYADEDRVEQILHNLVGNSVKFTESGEIRVSAVINSNMAEIIVSDTGIGVAPDKMDRIFEAFEQIDGSATRRHGGTGLGLAISRQLVRLHGGQLWSAEKHSPGAEFHFTLPLANDARHTDAEAPDSYLLSPIARVYTPLFQGDAEAPPTVSHTATGDEYSRYRILIADDEPVNIRVLKNQLRLRRFDVEIAASGDAVLDILETEGSDIDLVLLDVMMPGMSGYEVCRHLRRTYDAFSLPVIMLTARNRIEDLVEGFRSGANDYLPKPFTREELMARIDAHIHLKCARDDLKAAFDRIADLRMLLDNIIDSMPSAVIGVDRAGHVTKWNVKAADITGVPLETAEGQLLADIFNFPNLDKELLADVIHLNKVVKKEKIPYEKGGRRNFYDVTVYPLSLEPAPGAVIRIDDVTAKMQMEALMIQSEKMMSMAGMAAGLAHEIKNPFGVALQVVQVLQNRLSGGVQKNNAVAEACGTTIAAIEAYVRERGVQSLLTTIYEAGRRGLDIVEDMLSFSRNLDSGLFTRNDVIELLETALKFCASDYTIRKHYHFHDIEIIRAYEEGAFEVMGSKGQLQQVFLNLLKNSVHAVALDKDRPSRITLRVKKEQTMVIISVADNGPGMTEDVRSRIFEPFFTTKPEGVGNGLGLSISYYIIVDHHKGMIEAHSTPRNGTTITVRLPAVRD